MLELGQFLSGRCENYETKEWVDALIDYLLEKIKIVYVNKYHKIFDEVDDLDNIELKGIIVSSYYWGDDEKEIKKPNLKFKGLKQEIQWYKYPGRGQTSKYKYTDLEWIDWFNKALKIIRKNNKY